MVKPLEYLTYRGREGQWAWILHRVTGLGVLLFLLIHILDIAVIGWGPTWFNKLLFLYRATPFRLGEVALAAAVLYHALNGVRIVIIDFWPAATTVHRRMAYAVWIAFGVVFVPTAIYMLSDIVR